MGVEHGTCRTIHETHLDGILSQKNLTRSAGGVSGGQDPMEGFRRAGTLRPPLALSEGQRQKQIFSPMGLAYIAYYVANQVSTPKKGIGLYCLLCSQSSEHSKKGD